MEGKFNLMISRGKTGLFFIKDSVSDVRISGFMEFPTEAHACMSFSQFIAKQKDDTKIENINCYKLVLSSVVDDKDNVELMHNMVICDGSNCVEMTNLYIDAYKTVYEE